MGMRKFAEVVGNNLKRIFFFNKRVFLSNMMLKVSFLLQTSLLPMRTTYYCKTSFGKFLLHAPRMFLPVSRHAVDF